MNFTYSGLEARTILPHVVAVHHRLPLTLDYDHGGRLIGRNRRRSCKPQRQIVLGEGHCFAADQHMNRFHFRSKAAKGNHAGRLVKRQPSFRRGVSWPIFNVGIHRVSALCEVGVHVLIKVAAFGAVDGGCVRSICARLAKLQPTPQVWSHRASDRYSRDSCRPRARK